MIHATYINSGITGDGQTREPFPWQAKCKAWLPFSLYFDI